MAAVANTNLVTITINDRDVQVPKGELIVESVKRLGLEIPIFCYHPRMKPVGMCRMCLVEVGFRQQDGSVRMMPKPQAGCTLPASEGMVVLTDSEMVHRDRKGVLEFLLINHPLDCPICDRGGECPLQNNTLFYGPSTSRFVEMKRHQPKAFPLSEYVTLDLERCIQCGRCVRFTEEISGDAELAFRFRGASMTPSTFELRRFESKFSGNVIEICPVGALTNAKYRFRARPWDLETRPSVCTVCSNGCNVWFDYRVQKVVRINGRTNEAVNEEWTCDKGKFGHDFYNASNRLTKVLARNENALLPTEWSEAYEPIATGFAAGGNCVAALVGPTLSNEDLFAVQKLFRTLFKSHNFDHRFTKHLPTPTPPVQTTIAALESEPTVMVFGTDLAVEAPIYFLRVRKAWFKHGAKVVVAHSEPSDADSFAHLVLRYAPGTAATLAQALAGQVSDVEAARITGVDAGRIAEARALVAATNAPILATRSLFNEQGGQDAVEALAACGRPSVLALGANDQGATELGLVPHHGPGHAPLLEGETPGLGTHGILEAAANGELDALWLIGCDPLTAHPDPDLVRRALENVPFLVVQHHEETEATSYASVVLPMTAPAEQDGSYTNAERRVQRIAPILPAKGDAKPVWRALEELTLRTTPRTPLFNAREVMDEIATVAPAFAAARYAELDGEGIVLGAATD